MRAGAREDTRLGGMTIIAAADGSALGNPGPAGWAWVVDRDCWDAGGWPEGTNNIGEFLAIVHALALCAKTGQTQLPIYSDSRNAIAWVKQRHCRT